MQLKLSQYLLITINNVISNLSIKHIWVDIWAQKYYFLLHKQYILFKYNLYSTLNNHKSLLKPSIFHGKIQGIYCVEFLY